VAEFELASLNRVARQLLMQTKISVSKKPDGKFDVSNNDELLNGSVTEEWLPRYLNAYLVEDKRDDVLRRLKMEDEVTAEILSFGKFEQI